MNDWRIQIGNFYCPKNSYYILVKVDKNFAYTFSNAADLMHCMVTSKIIIRLVHCKQFKQFISYSNFKLTSLDVKLTVNPWKINKPKAKPVTNSIMLNSFILIPKS